jgi:RNA polymerase sigma-70 factor (ECF subfamily)
MSFPEQLDRLRHEDLRKALARLPPDQREALILVTMSDLSYAAVADICGCKEGTIKSRVNRARLALAKLMELDGSEHLGPDGLTRVVLPSNHF